MDLDDVISLADAAEELDLAPATLRHQASMGRLRARLVGKTWITTKQEVERYRLEVLDKVGRPRGDAIQIALFPWRLPHASPYGLIRVIGFSDTPGDQIEALRLVVDEATEGGAQTMHDIMRAVRADPRTADLILVSGEVPPWIGIGRVFPKPAQLGLPDPD